MAGVSMPASSFRRSEEEQRRRQKITCLSGDDLSVRKLQGSGGSAGLFRLAEGCVHYRAVVDRDAGLVHEHFDLEHFLLRAGAGYEAVHCVVVAADDLLE